MSDFIVGTGGGGAPVPPNILGGGWPGPPNNDYPETYLSQTCNPVDTGQ